MPVGHCPSQGDGSLEWRAKLPQCPVCLDAFESDTEPTWVALHCGHTIHDLCWQQQLQYRPECPTCKCKLPKSQQKGLRLYLDASLVSGKLGASQQQQTPAAGSKTTAAASHPAEVALREVNQKLHAVLRDKQEQAEHFRQELSRLQGMHEAMQEQQQAQADKVNKLKSKLTEQKQTALIEQSRLKQEVDRVVETNRELQAEANSKQRALEVMRKDLVQLKIELEKATLTLGGYERNKLAKKLANLPSISEQALRDMCCISDTDKLDFGVLAAALADISKQLKQQQQLRAEAQAAQNQVQLESDKRVAGAQREAARLVAEQKEHVNKYRRELNDMEYYVATLEQRLLDAGLPVAGLRIQKHDVQDQAGPAALELLRTADADWTAAASSHRHKPVPCIQHASQQGVQERLNLGLHQESISNIATHPSASGSLPEPSELNSQVFVDLINTTPGSMEEAHCSPHPGLQKSKAPHPASQDAIDAAAAVHACAAGSQQYPAAGQVHARVNHAAPNRQPHGTSKSRPAVSVLGSSALTGAGPKRKAASDVLTNQPLKRAAEEAAAVPQTGGRPAAGATQAPMWPRAGLTGTGSGSFLAKRGPSSSSNATMGQPSLLQQMAPRTVCSLDIPGGLSSKPPFKKGQGNAKPNGSRAQQRSITGFLAQ